MVNSCGGCASSTQDKTVSACIGSANETGWSSSPEAVGRAGAWQAASKAGPAQSQAWPTASHALIYAFLAAAGFLGAAFFTAFFAVLGLVALGALGLSATFLVALGLAAAALGLAAALTFFTPAALGLAGAAFFAPAAAGRGHKRSSGQAGQVHVECTQQALQKGRWMLLSTCCIAWLTTCLGVRT